MFYTIEELVNQADQEFGGNVAELMIATEIEMTGRSREDIITIMSRNLEVMKESVQKGLTPTKSISGLTGGMPSKWNTTSKKGRHWLIPPFSLLLEMPWLSMN